MNASFRTDNLAQIPRSPAPASRGTFQPGGSAAFWAAKRVFDLAVSLILLPFLGIFAVAIVLANPFCNRGLLFFVQIRMGRDCRPFGAIKFRSMTHEARIARGPDDPLEAHRITPLGGFLRRTRIDELPQILNVLRGEMSLIGPRPDYIVHARSFLRDIPEYRMRHSVRPGISGLAQVDLGYAVGMNATRVKAILDLDYIHSASFALDIRILLKTLQVILARRGT